MTETSELGGLYCELSLPLEWAAVDGTAALSSANEAANQNCLKIALGLDEVVHDATDDTAELSQELQRLDFKVNIILELVARLVSQTTALPPSHSLKLGPSALQWLVPAAPGQPGQSLQLKLYLDQRFPFPLCLSGRISSVEQVERGCQVLLEFDPMQDYTRELLEKYIFRCHRRHIARIKTLTNNN